MQPHKIDWIRGALRSATHRPAAEQPAQRERACRRESDRRCSQALGGSTAGVLHTRPCGQGALAPPDERGLRCLSGPSHRDPPGGLRPLHPRPPEATSFLWAQGLLALAGTLYVLRERLLLEEQVNLYAAHARLFAYEEKLLPPHAAPDARQLTRIENLGRSALLENGLWLALHSTRAPDVF